MILKMCIGREEAQEDHQKNHKPFSCSSKPENNASISCELCNSKASLYCQADDAFLCRKCDKWVHSANFLAQRHIRCLLCNTCRCLTQRYLVGVSVEVTLPTVVRSSTTDSTTTTAGGHCNPDLETEYTRTVKEPFLFL
ncbi:hypothetical protein M9H77_20019 [Catharanthus roseus]|uniref:Uncharacterized protein n=1 Tax=Catharanthus roseus TaxID=4058 RepID=A0ACC0AJB6_CATRO|nr:hypothetical protein M9H77_20019 [Catharanthus roseus]